MGRKFALLIGNDEYDDPGFEPLYAPFEDVQGLEAVLRRPDIGGFEDEDVTVLHNPSLELALRHISQLFARRSKDDLLLFYYSGHGEKDSDNDLFLTLKGTDRDLLDGTVILASSIKSIMHKSASHRQLLLLDCCYSGAFGDGLKGNRDLAITEADFGDAGFGREIMTATDGRQHARESKTPSDDSHKSLFTRILIEGLESGEAAAEGQETITVQDLFEYTHRRVKQEQPAMTPKHWRLKGEGSLVIAKNANPVAQLHEDLLRDVKAGNIRTRRGAIQELRELAETGRRGEQRAALKLLSERLDKERDRFIHEEIKQILEQDSREDGEISPIEAKETKADAGAVFRDTLRDGSLGPEMVVIPSGNFQMGDSQGDGNAEQPVHGVTIAKPFGLGKYPVTFDEYDAYAQATKQKKPADEGWGRGNRPVINVSWDNAVAYVKWLCKQTGKSYRLPSEAEWEYAARAGTETAYWWGDEIGETRTNCDESGSDWSGKTTSPVGSFPENPFGLCDTAGNVWEWTEDCWHETYEGAPNDGSAWLEDGDCARRVLRGGSWGGLPGNVRSANRDWYNSVNRNDLVGFRLAQDL